MTSWKYKVVKRQRGAEGKYFSYPAAATFAAEADAREYAKAFAAEQKGVAGTKIDVRTRGNRTLAEIDPRTGNIFECR